MPMNKQKNHRLIALLLLATVSIAVLAAGAQDQAAEPAKTVTPSESVEQTSPETGDVVTVSPEDEQKTPPENAAAPRTIKEFKPTEKIEADSAVSFPIDI